MLFELKSPVTLVPDPSRGDQQTNTCSHTRTSLLTEFIGLGANSVIRRSNIWLFNFEMQPPKQCSHVHKMLFMRTKKANSLKEHFLITRYSHNFYIFPLVSHHDNNPINSYLGKTWSYLGPFQSYLGQIIGAIFFIKLAPRPIQSISWNVCVSYVVPSWKQCFPVDSDMEKYSFLHKQGLRQNFFFFLPEIGV